MRQRRGRGSKGGIADWRLSGADFRNHPLCRSRNGYNPFADPPRCCHPLTMKLWILIVASGVACAGCAGPITGPVTPGTTNRLESFGPSDDEIETSYKDLVNTVCSSTAPCEREGIINVSQVECSGGRRDQSTCRFVLVVERPMAGAGITSLATEGELHSCTALFRRHNRGWRIRSIIEECHPTQTQKRSK